MLVFEFLSDLNYVIVLMEMIEVNVIDFSLKLSTQSVRLNSSLRSFISFSEMKKKLQSLH